jgi:4-hydroxybenzoyl-CoA thioesterase
MALRYTRTLAAQREGVAAQCMFTNKRTIHIEWGDCDPAGIVYYPRYFEFFDASTQELFAAAGLAKQEIMRKYRIAGIPMVDTRAQFFVPCTFGDVVEIETRISGFGRSSFSVQHKLLKGGVLAAEGFEKRVWTVRSAENGRMKSEPIPREVIERFER